MWTPLNAYPKTNILEYLDSLELIFQDDIEVLGRF